MERADSLTGMPGEVHNLAHTYCFKFPSLLHSHKISGLLYSLCLIMALSYSQVPFTDPVGSLFDLHRPAAPNIHAITNVHIFDGKDFTSNLGTIIIKDDLICQVIEHGEKPSHSCEYDIEDAFDGQGNWLLPGFIDSHMHIANSSSDLTATQRQLLEEGVTGGLDMGSFPYSLIQLFNKPPYDKLPYLWGSGAAATGNASFLGLIPGFPKDSFVLNEDDANTFVADRIAEGVDYIKIVFDNLLAKASPMLPTPDCVKTLVRKAHDNKKLVVAHAVQYSDWTTAINAGVDIITHTPLTYLDEAVLDKLKGPFIPTLIKMASQGPGIGNSTEAVRYINSNSNVKILVGTDSQDDQDPLPYVPIPGSMAIEMEYLAKAGLTPLKIILGATEYPVSVFKLGDRGRIRNKYRADLVLVADNPLANISAVRTASSVWLAGARTDLKRKTKSAPLTELRRGL